MYAFCSIPPSSNLHCSFAQAAEAHERQKAASREKSERATFGGSKDDLMKELLTFLQPRENVIRVGLRRIPYGTYCNGE